MADQMKDLLKYAKNNPDILKALSFAKDNAGLISAAPVLANTVQNVINPVETLPSTVVESLQTTGSDQNLNESINVANTLFNVKYIIIGALVLWAILIIVVRFMTKEEQTKKDIEFINTTLFGNSGIVPIILSIWVLSVLAVTLLPLFIEVVPKISVLSDSLSTFLVELPKLIPALI